MRKEAAFDRIILGTVAGIVSHAKFNTQVVGEQLQVLLEQMLIGRVAATAITQ